MSLAIVFYPYTIFFWCEFRCVCVSLSPMLLLLFALYVLIIFYHPGFFSGGSLYMCVSHCLFVHLHSTSIAIFASNNSSLKKVIITKKKNSTSNTKEKIILYLRFDYVCMRAYWFQFHVLFLLFDVYSVKIIIIMMMTFIKFSEIKQSDSYDRNKWMDFRSSFHISLIPNLNNINKVIQ